MVASLLGEGLLESEAAVTGSYSYPGSMVQGSAVCNTTVPRGMKSGDEGSSDRLHGSSWLQRYPRRRS